MLFNWFQVPRREKTRFGVGRTTGFIFYKIIDALRADDEWRKHERNEYPWERFKIKIQKFGKPRMFVHQFSGELCFYFTVKAGVARFEHQTFEYARKRLFCESPVFGAEDAQDRKNDEWYDTHHGVQYTRLGIERKMF